jgi:integrase
MRRLRGDQRLRIMNVPVHPDVLRLADPENDPPAALGGSAAPLMLEFNGMRIQCNTMQQMLELMNSLPVMKEKVSAGVMPDATAQATPETAVAHSAATPRDIALIRDMGEKPSNDPSMDVPSVASNGPMFPSSRLEKPDASDHQLAPALAALAAALSGLRTGTQLAVTAPEAPESENATPSSASLGEAMTNYLAHSQSTGVVIKTMDMRRALLECLATTFGKTTSMQEVADRFASQFWPQFAAMLRGRDGKRRSPKTLLSRLREFSFLFEFAEESRWVTHNPVDTMKLTIKTLKKAKTLSDGRYRSFKSAELSQVFDAIRFWRWNRRYPDQFWVPLISLHSGMRMGEIMQLEVQDFKVDIASGRPCIDIPEPTEKRRVKNKNAVRVVPIHCRLIELGLLDYVQAVRSSGSTHLFNFGRTRKDFQKDPSKNMSRHFASYLDKLDLNDPHLVFHSFRHTVATRLHREGLSLLDAMALLGHGIKDDAAKFGLSNWSAASGSAHLRYLHQDDDVGHRSDVRPDSKSGRLGSFIDAHLTFDLNWNELLRMACQVKPQPA